MVFTVGFCFGGRNSWLAAASGHGLAGAVGFYGMPGDRGDGLPGPIDRALTEAGVEHEVVTFEGAPHSFFDRSQEDYAEASEDAWRRVLDFLGRHS